MLLLRMLPRLSRNLQSENHVLKNLGMKFLTLKSEYDISSTYFQSFLKQIPGIDELYAGSDT